MKNNSTNIIYLGTLYLLSASTLYLFGFWDNFGINILEYIAVADIIKLAIKNLIFCVALSLIGFIVQEVLIGRHLQPGGGAKTSVGRAINGYWDLFLFFNVILIISIYLFVPAPTKWLYIAIFVMAPGSVFLGKMDYFVRLLPNPMTRRNFLIVLTAIPLFSYWWGNEAGYKIYSGNAKYTINEKESIFKNLSLNHGNLLYIGMMGDKLFLIDKETKNIYIHKASSEDLLVLIPIKKGQEDNCEGQSKPIEKHNKANSADTKSRAAD